MFNTGAGPPAAAEPIPTAAPSSGLAPGASPCEAPAFPPDLLKLEARALENHTRMDAIARQMTQLADEYRRRLHDDRELTMRIDHLKARRAFPNI